MDCGQSSRKLLKKCLTESGKMMNFQDNFTRPKKILPERSETFREECSLARWPRLPRSHQVKDRDRISHVLRPCS